jgi:dethiobiotin synthetase
VSRVYFITGTDTGVGKTSVAVALLQAAVKRGLSTAAAKPVAAGCEVSGDGLRNDDALFLQQACTTALSYEQINPFTLQPAIAPHFAAAREGLRLDAQSLALHCQTILDLKADFTVIEGAGGWRVPLNDSETFADLAKRLKVPVILVVDIKLGCLNHALLSAEAIRADGLVLAGWVANQASGVNECHDEMVADLEHRMACPLLGDLPHCLDQAELPAHLDLNLLSGL